MLLNFASTDDESTNETEKIRDHYEQEDNNNAKRTMEKLGLDTINEPDEEDDFGADEFGDENVY